MAVANAHLTAASPNRLLLEMNMTPDPFKEEVLKDGPLVKDGYFDISDKPGLGVELREGLEETYPPLPGIGVKVRTFPCGNVSTGVASGAAKRASGGLILSPMPLPGECLMPDPEMSY